jgi:hypothetical protein
MTSPEESADRLTTPGPTITSQMLTLGLDASDGRSPKRSVEMVDSTNESERNTWWNRAFHSTDGGLDSRIAAAVPSESDRPRIVVDEVDTNYSYEQMGEHLTINTHTHENVNDSRKGRAMMQQGIRKVGGTFKKLQKTWILNSHSRRSLSDRSHMILRDGHFYYRDMESAGPCRNDVESQCNYFQAPSSAADTELKRYRERFEDLNKDAKCFELDRLLLDNDLQLDHTEDVETNELQRDARSSILHTAQTSSLYYEVEGGGMTLLCLPRDHVRLTMDPELQTGTLAVEQWRREDETRYEVPLSQRPSCSFCPNCKKEFTFGRDFSIHPDLRYTLVVNDDLYRNLMSELSSHLTEPYCGINRWCLDDEKVDIRVAIGFLIIVFSLMFATTIVWPTQ